MEFAPSQIIIVRFRTETKMGVSVRKYRRITCYSLLHVSISLSYFHFGGKLVGMLRSMTAKKGYTYEYVCLYKRGSSVRARSGVPGLVFARHARVVGSTSIENILFNLVI